MRVHASKAVFLSLIWLFTALPSAATGQPVLLNEAQRIDLPEPYLFASDVCLVGGDLLVIAGRRDFADPNREAAWALIHLRRQADGAWSFVRELAAVTYDANADIWSSEDLACEGPLAAFSTPEGPSFAVERTPAGWQATRLAGLDRGSAAAVRGDAIAIAGSWRSPTTVALVRRDAVGAWTDVTYVVGNPGSRGNSEFTGPPAVWVAATEIAAEGREYEPPGQDESISDMQVFDLINGSWRLTTLPRPLPAAVINDRVALQMRMWTEPGDVASFFIRDASGAWTDKHTLLSDERLLLRDFLFVGERAFAISGLNRGDIAVFRRESPGRYRHEASLAASNLATSGFTSLLRRFHVDGEWIAATGDGALYLFRVPAQLPTPQLLERTFENNSTAGWTFTGDADWRIVSAGGTRLLRQSRTTGMAFAILEPSEGDNQSIQADVRINELGPGTPWAGFVLRYTDAQNYYYLLVNRTSVQIRKIVNGSFGPIATAPFSLVLGRWYNFRLEAIGSRLRMFVNGQQVGEVIDEAHASGRAGMTMWRARTDYDNVIVSDSPQTDLFVDTFSETFEESQRPWTTIAQAGAWSIATSSSGERVYRQNLISGGPRTVNGGVTGDQIVSVDVRPRAFNTSGGGWVGVMVRYTDNFNNYFLMLHQSGRASVRKRVNGVYTLLEEVPFTVTPNTTYRVRIEAIGSSVRIYVNHRLLAEGVDANLATGRYGLVTFNATADFDNFRAIRP